MNRYALSWRYSKYLEALTILVLVLSLRKSIRPELDIPEEMRNLSWRFYEASLTQSKL